MPSYKFEMSLDQQIPTVMIKKAQMSGDSPGPGSQCGLTSLLPMSCRGHAEAFARKLNSRLRNLDTVQGDSDEGENSWLTHSVSNNSPTSSTQRDLDTIYGLEVECESPSSPVDEIEPSFHRPTTDDKEPIFCDTEPVENLKNETKPVNAQNGFRFSTAFYTGYSPIRRQPVPRENGHEDKKLFSPITFEGVARTNSSDEIDHVSRSPSTSTHSSLPSDGYKSQPSSPVLVSDLYIKTARSETSESVDDILENNEEDSQTDNIFGMKNLNTVLEENSEIEIGEEVLEENLCQENVSSYLSKNDIEIEGASVEKDISLSENVSTTLSPENKTEEEDYDRPQRVRRCSSLKTGKTPPGTPGRKKIVRFADVLGLDLADVKTFMDEIPVVPKSAYDDLSGCDVTSSPPARAPLRLGSLTLVPLFQLSRDVTEKLEKQNVCLESARVCDGVHVTICGSVRVRNLDFHKSVHVRHTMNGWKTYTDLQAMYVQGSCDGYSDKFQFTLYAPCITSGQRLELAVRFQCKGQQFWDNNNGANYCFDCLALGALSPSLSSSGPLHPTIDWHPSFY